MEKEAAWLGGRTPPSHVSSSSNVIRVSSTLHANLWHGSWLPLRETYLPLCTARDDTDRLRSQISRAEGDVLVLYALATISNKLPSTAENLLFQLHTSRHLRRVSVPRVNRVCQWERREKLLERDAGINRKLVEIFISRRLIKQFKNDSNFREEQ